MSTKSFGDQPESRNFAEELYELVGVSFPLTLRVTNGQLVSLTYESEWQEGSTTAVANGEDGFDYQQDYKKKSLTKAQQKKVEDWAAENVVGSTDV